MTLFSGTEKLNYAGEVAADAPLHWWRLNDLTDAGSAPAALTVTGGVTTGQPGALTGDANGAAALDGTTGLLNLAAPVVFAGDFTLEFWTYLTKEYDAQASSGTLNNAVLASSVAASQNGGNGTIRLLLRPNGLLVGLYGGAAAGELTGGYTPGTLAYGNVKAWVHWAVVRTGSTVITYRNGVALDSRTMTNGTVSFDKIGLYAGGSYRYGGSIDEVAVYTTALSAARVGAHYQAGAGNRSAPQDAYTILASSPGPRAPVVYGRGELLNYRAAVLADTPLSYWRLGEVSGATQIVDLMGAVAASATAVFGTSFGQPPVAGMDTGDTGVAFTTSSSRITAGDVYGFTGTAPFSAEFWLYLTALHPTSYLRLLSKEGAPSNKGWSVYLSPTGASAAGSGIAFARFDDTGGTTTAGTLTGAISVGRWYHVVSTYDGTTMRMYVNGRAVSGGNASAQVITAYPTQPFTIGGLSGSPGGAPLGLLPGSIMDEVAIYGYALSQQQVWNHFAAVGNYAPSQDFPRRTPIYKRGATDPSAAADTGARALLLSRATTNASAAGDVAARAYRFLRATAEASAASDLLTYSRLAFEVRPSYRPFAGGVIMVDDFRTLDVATALAAGGGIIQIDPTDLPLVQALRTYPPLWPAR